MIESITKTSALGVNGLDSLSSSLTAKSLTVGGALTGTNRFASLAVTRAARFVGPVAWNAGSLSLLSSKLKK